MYNKTFRLFISSTFSDFVNERELLQKEVFPKLEIYCESKGFQFQSIDLRWGVNEEAQLDQKTLEVCLEEVKICKHFPYPNFLIMIGNKYGWIPLPYAIEKSEFKKILKYTKQNNNNNIEIIYFPYKDKNGNIVQPSSKKVTKFDLLNQWYKLDKNQIPESYILQERTGIYVQYENWNIEEEHLREILQEAILNLNFNKNECYKYFTSATEHEVIEGIFEYLHLTPNQQNLLNSNYKKYSVDTNYIYCFIREINKVDDKKNDLYIDSNLEQVKKFKKQIINTLKKENICKVLVNLNNKGLEKSYLNTFKNFIIQKLKKSIDEQIHFINSLDIQDNEINEQENFLQEKIKMFIGRDNDKKVLHQYLENNLNEPLIVYGKSGSGKSSLIAKFISELPNTKKQYTVYRFVGATPNSSETKSLLISILNQLDYQINVDLSLEDISHQFYEFIMSYKKELIIIIDAVDQFYNKDNFTWLPTKLPSNVKIIITALKDDNYIEDSKYFEILSIYHKNKYLLSSLEIDDSSILKILSSYNRKLTKEQLTYVNEKYSKVKSPLYLKFAIEEIKHWKSTDRINSDITLESTQKEIIKKFINNLSKIYKHDSILVEKVMSYIFVSNGLTEKELIDFLSMDKEFVNIIAPQIYHKNYSNKIPMSVWVRLQFQLKPFITLKNSDGFIIMQFFHREFNDAIRELFNVDKLHLELIQFSYQKLITERYNFNSNRIGKLFTDLVIKYALKNKDKDFITKNFHKLLQLDAQWLQNFLQYNLQIINNYYKNGLVVEAKIIGLAIYNDKELFEHMIDKYNFLFILGELEQSQGLTQNAIDFYKESLKYTNEETAKISANIQIAKTLRHSGKTQKAIEILEKLLNNQLLSESIERADALIQLGLCKFSEKKYKEALNYYNLADQYIVNHTNNRKLKLYNWLGISTVLAFMGDVQKGLDLLIKIKNESKQFGFQNFYIDSLNGIAKKYLMLGDYEQAEKFAKKALELASKQENRRICFLMHGYLVEAYAGQYSQNKDNKNSLIHKVENHLAQIDYYKKKKLVTETILNELVDESIAKWFQVLKK